MEQSYHNDEFSIAVDKALLKLSKEFGVSIRKDDYVLIQLFLSKEIIELTLKTEIDKLINENVKTKNYFREALILTSKQHNEKIKTYQKIVTVSIIVSSVALLISMISYLSKYLGY